MADIKTRTLRYRRISWSNMVERVFLKDMEYHLKKAHQKLSTVRKRTFPYGEGQLQGLNYSLPNNPGGILIHVVYCVPDENTSLIDKPTVARKTNRVKVASAPNGTDFMKRDIMFYLKSNHLIICPSGVKERAIAYYIREMLIRSKVKRDNVKFDIEKIANAQKIRLIQNEGVKAVHLNTSLYKASIDYIKRKSPKNKLLKIMSEHLEAIIGKDDDTKNAHADIHAKIILAVDGRSRTSSYSQENLGKVASSLINENDSNYLIETGSGKRISPDEIEINSKVNLTCRGNSVSCDHAWQSLMEYYAELRSGGFLEQ